jgi:D-methionine transport system substrate-binding protein
MTRRHPTRRLLMAAALALALAGNALAADLQVIRIGVTPGPHAQILEAVKPIAARAGLDLKIIEFTDYVVPNEALNSGELDANSFQNQPYLDHQKRDRGYDIVGVGLTVNFPLGLYSKKHKSWAELPEGATIAIQNDPTNGGRSLLLLQDKGVLTLKPDVGFQPSVADIVKNPRALHFVEVDAAQTPRTLDDVDAAAINTNYATEAGLKPEDAILREDPKGPYVNLIAVRTKDKDAPWVTSLLDAYRSPEVKTFLAEKFKGAVLPSW